jgi:tetratricopeptide (TPR) repeat protein
MLAKKKGKRKSRGKKAKTSPLPAWLDAPKAFRNVGLMFEKILDWDDAVQSYRSAVAADPGYGEAFVSLGLLYGKAEQPDAAEQAYMVRVVIIIFPPHLPTHAVAAPGRG